MSECNHNCESCGENCSQRTIQKAKTNEKSKIKHVIGIVSGKGGVGKSFVTSLLASGLRKKGHSVGILDGDITGPSIPKSFDIHSAAEGDGVQYIYPAETTSGIKIISANMMLPHEEDPIIWRGTLISSLLTQFFSDVVWGELEYLLIDMPPGTGDVPLTAFQQLPLDGVIIVTSPQDLVSMIVKKQINMAKMMNIPILGIVENMSYVLCPNCNEKIQIFGDSKVETVAKQYSLKVLAKLPIRLGNSNLIDNGKIESIDVPEFYEVVEAVEKL